MDLLLYTDRETAFRLLREVPFRDAAVGKVLAVSKKSEVPAAAKRVRIALIDMDCPDGEEVLRTFLASSPQAKAIRLSSRPDSEPFCCTKPVDPKTLLRTVIDLQLSFTELPPVDCFEHRSGFWTGLLCPSEPYDTVINRSKAYRAGIVRSEQDRFILVRIGLFDILQFGEIEWYGLRPCLECGIVALTAVPPLSAEAVIEEKLAGHFWLVLRQEKAVDLQERLMQFRAFCETLYLHTEFCWVTDCSASDLRGAADQIRAVGDDAGHGKGWCIDARRYTFSCGYSSKLFAPLYDVLIHKGHDAFIDALQQKIDGLTAAKPQSHVYYMVRPDIERLLRRALTAKQVDLSHMEDARCMELLEQAHLGPSLLMKYVKAALRPIRNRFTAAVTYPEPVQRIIRYLDENATKPYSRSVLSEIAGLNSNYLATMFKEATGQSVSAYRGMKQMEQAAQLLSESKLPIAEIAEQTGFGDQTYFCTAFRKQFGISPGEYRKNHKK